MTRGPEDRTAAPSSRPPLDERKAERAENRSRQTLRASVALLALLTAFALTACGKPKPITDCVEKDHARPLCIFRRPEDLVLVTDPKAPIVVISQMGGGKDGSDPGNLVFYYPNTNWVTAAFVGEYSEGVPATAGWGDSACPGPPGRAFSPHGLSFGRRPDGKLELLAVNHGGRESVEFFEVFPDIPAIAWHGCAVAPGDVFLNDVALLPDGGFVVTDMFPRGRMNLYGFLGMLGFSTGYVLEWQPDKGFHKIEGSDGRMPNGVEVSPDGETLYVNMYLAGEVRKLSRRTGETLGRAKVAHPDNSIWAADGSLLVASHDASVSNVMACSEIEKGACPAEFSVVRLDASTMSTETLYHNEGPPMGAGTAALRIGDELFIGTFAGDRILRVGIAPPPSAAPAS